MNAPEPLVLGRQPIFDAQQRLWGYEVFCLAQGRPAELLAEPSTALTCLAASAYMGLQEVSERGRRIVVRFQEKPVLDHIPYALPSSMGVLKLAEESAADSATLELLARLKSDGYLIALDRFTGRDGQESLHQLADILCLDCGAEALDRHLSRARRLPARLLASEVNDRRRMEHCRAVGFHLLQGSFYKSPEGVPIRKLSANQVARLRLLELIEDPDPGFDRLAEAIQSDATLTFRLLTYLNSAAFGFRHSIKSVRQAIVLLGWTKTRNWLRVVLLSELSSSPETTELVRLAAQRGKFLEGLAQRFDYWAFQPDTLQLAGLFSLLDVILQTPMEDVVRYLPVDDKLKAALRQESNNEYVPLLRLAALLEDDRLEEAGNLVQQLGLSEEAVMTVFRSAVAWANQFSAVPVGAP